eukprot:4957950-Pyramimonas_sp.AAC.1
MGQMRQVPTARPRCKPCGDCQRAGETRDEAKGCSGIRWSRGPHLWQRGRPAADSCLVAPIRCTTAT